MNFIRRRPWHIPESQHTPKSVFHERSWHRREFLRSIGASASGLLLGASGCSGPTDQELDAAGRVSGTVDAFGDHYPAARNDSFDYGRPETIRRAAAEYANFYEFSRTKKVYRYVGGFTPAPWSFEVDGMCAKPRAFDLDDLHQLFELEERAYRHRCVETWAMCVPWTGFPLHRLLTMVEPTAEAKFVRFESFTRPQEARNQQDNSFPWPYSEALTMPEALNELTMMVTGVFGTPLPKQHGAPVRIVVPWKYGFKGGKSIVRITLTDEQPATFWNSLAPHEYGFTANVDPAVPHPRWSQAREWMLGTYDEFDTVQYNGYGEFVASLYGV